MDINKTALNLSAGRITVVFADSSIIIRKKYF